MLFVSCLRHSHHDDGRYQYDKAKDKYSDGLTTHPFPLFQEDAPNVAEGNIQRHQDAPREGVQHGTVSQKALAHLEAEEL